MLPRGAIQGIRCVDLPRCVCRAVFAALCFSLGKESRAYSGQVKMQCCDKQTELLFLSSSSSSSSSITNTTTPLRILILVQALLSAQGPPVYIRDPAEGHLTVYSYIRDFCTLHPNHLSLFTLHLLRGAFVQWGDSLTFTTLPSFIRKRHSTDYSN